MNYETTNSRKTLNFAAEFQFGKNFAVGEGNFVLLDAAIVWMLVLAICAASPHPYIAELLHDTVRILANALGIAAGSQFATAALKGMAAGGV